MLKIRMWQKFHLDTRYYSYVKVFSIDFIIFTQVQTAVLVKILKIDLTTHNA